VDSLRAKAIETARIVCPLRIAEIEMVSAKRVCCQPEPGGATHVRGRFNHECHSATEVSTTLNSLSRSPSPLRMKQITGITTGIIHVSSTRTTNLTQAHQLEGYARRNKSKVLNSALAIENTLSSILSYYFYGATHERKGTFELMILNTNFCGFSEKRKLVVHVINELGLLNGKEKGDFEESLGRMIKYRNEFAHGSLSSDDTTVWLSYFDGAPQKKELNDDYLTTVEQTIFEVFNTLTAIEAKLKGSTEPPIVLQPHPTSNPPD